MAESKSQGFCNLFFKFIYLFLILNKNSIIAAFIV